MSTQDAIRIRRSAFEALLRCGAWENDNSAAAAFGTAVHEAIAAWVRVCKIEGRAVEPVMAMVPHRDPEVFALLQRFTATHGPNLDTLHGVEVMLETEAAGAVLTGTVDRLDFWPLDATHRAALVSDWKSGWHQADHAFQMRWYAAEVVLNFPDVSEVVVRADYIRLTDGITEETYTREELLEWWDTEVVPYVPVVLDRIANGGEREGGSACQYCARRYACANGVAPFRDEPQDDTQAALMMGELVRLQAAAKAREDALRTYLEDRAPLTHNGMVAGFIASGKESEHIDRKAAIAAGLFTREPAAPRWGLKKAAS